MTIRDSLEAGLKQLGWARVVTHTRKYRVYRKDDSGLKIYLGQNGGCRIGRTLKDSRPVSDEFRRELYEASVQMPEKFLEKLGEKID